MSEEKLYAVKNDEGKWLNQYCFWGTETWATSDKAEREKVANRSGGHVVELVEAPENVVVSQEEAEMLKKAKNKTVWRPAAVISEYAYNAAKDSKQEALLEDRLMRAYVIGWTVEKPKRWNVKVPQTDDLYWHDAHGLHAYGDAPKRLYIFTSAEIEHYGLGDCQKVEVTDDEQ